MRELNIIIVLCFIFRDLKAKPQFYNLKMMGDEIAQGRCKKQTTYRSFLEGKSKVCLQKVPTHDPVPITAMGPYDRQQTVSSIG